MTQSILPADQALPGLGGATRFEGAHFDDADALAERLVGFALEKRIRLATAESCTAGLIAHMLSRPAGSASVLVGGFVTYTKDAKTRLLGVSPDLFGAAGAIDPDVAKVMARGALERSGADCAIAVTGVTGSEPDEDGNPIGRVFTGLATPQGTYALHCEFGALAAKALTHLAVQAALLFALARLGERRARDTLAHAAQAGR
ncbi:nicotinamide-nucleotide amidohydrolase family protein [Bosea sp. (in: a-proteobacteria)]|uniref:CinA family protein n=1 Tax=Bosea sp. (in: a-proteobacteria) TaxID=1871050 RepID=UPI0025BD8F30|nr:nicotinamide-nucleotide amidohydrolase family protein [Bosea sp. (in: a-proteobacteria)]